jgi:hypothetical protein
MPEEHQRGQKVVCRFAPTELIQACIQIYIKPGTNERVTNKLHILHIRLHRVGSTITLRPVYDPLYSLRSKRQAP